MADAIRALQPGYVIIENVPGIATKMGSRPGESALGTVVADLAEAGYVGSWIRLRASDVGAPHKRERVFVLASNPERVRVDAGAELRGGSQGEPGRSPQEAVSPWPQVARTEDSVPYGTPAADAVRERLDRSGRSDAQFTSGERGDRGTSTQGPPLLATDAYGGGRSFIGVSEARGIERASRDIAYGRDREGEKASSPDTDIELSRDAGRVIGGEGRRPGSKSNTETLADTNSERREEHGGAITGEAQVAAADGDSERREWGIYTEAIVRWERELGRSAPRPTDDRGRLNPEFTTWMMGFPEGWTAGETRTQQLKMLGNSVVVQVGEVVGRMLRG